MGQQRDWLVFAFLTILTILLNSLLSTESQIQSVIIPRGIGASLFSVPIWAIIGGIVLFGGFV